MLARTVRLTTPNSTSYPRAMAMFSHWVLQNCKACNSIQKLAQEPRNTECHYFDTTWNSHFEPASNLSK